MMDRIFLDANVLFSIAYGSPGLNHFKELTARNRCLLFASSYVIEEVKRNITTPKQTEALEAFLLRVHVTPDADPEIPCPVELPEKDRPVLLTAISSKANYLVTGDATHFGKYFGKVVSGVKICRPRDYFDERPASYRRKGRPRNR